MHSHTLNCPKRWGKLEFIKVMMISKMILITNVPDSINQNYERKVENQEREKQSTSVVD